MCSAAPGPAASGSGITEAAITDDDIARIASVGGAAVEAREYRDLFNRRIVFINETSKTFYITILEQDRSTLTQASAKIGVKDLFTLEGSAEWDRLPDVAQFVTVPPGAGTGTQAPVKIPAGSATLYGTFVRSDMAPSAAAAGDTGPFIAFMRCQIKGGHKYKFKAWDAKTPGLKVPLVFPM